MLKSLILQRRDEEPGRAKAFHQVTQQIGEREIERPRNTGAWGFRGNWATELEVRQRSRELEENRERKNLLCSFAVKSQISQTGENTTIALITVILKNKGMNS